jgi:hypothetical protein
VPRARRTALITARSAGDGSTGGPSFSVRNIVQSWLNGTTNDGFVVKAANESNLNVGGPRYEASGYFYEGEVVTYPQLVSPTACRA